MSVDPQRRLLRPHHRHRRVRAGMLGSGFTRHFPRLNLPHARHLRRVQADCRRWRAQEEDQSTGIGGERARVTTPRTEGTPGGRRRGRRNRDGIRQGWVAQYTLQRPQVRVPSAERLQGWLRTTGARRTRSDQIKPQGVCRGRARKRYSAVIAGKAE